MTGAKDPSQKEKGGGKITSRQSLERWPQLREKESRERDGASQSPEREMKGSRLDVPWLQWTGRQDGHPEKDERNEDCVKVSDSEESPSGASPETKSEAER